MQLSESDIDRLEENWCSKPDTGCHMWTGYANRRGYGVLTVRVSNGKGVQVPAHRAAWMAFVGPIPGGQQVLHGCDTPRCINPAHLRCGSNADNVADKVSRGRQASGDKIAGHQRGSLNHRAKLSEGQVRYIRGAYASGGCTMRTLASLHGVSLSTVSDLIRRKRWSHI